MNKIASLLSIVAICAGFSACDEVEESLSKPQENPQETIFDSQSLTITPVSEAVNLSNPESAEVKVASWTVSDFPAASTLGVKVELAKTESYANAATLDAQVDSTGAVMVNAKALNNAYKSVITRNPAEGTAYVRFIAYAINGTEVVRLGGPDTFYGANAIKVIPENEANVIENTYYLSFGNQKIEFAHSDVDPYDDPKFSVSFESVVGEKWTIVSGTGKSFGPADSEDGGLLAAGAAAGTFTEAGPHKMEINMRDLTYNISLAIEKLYTPGNSNGWSQPNSQVLTTSDYVTYRGFAHLNGEFKFSSKADWSGINYGNTGVEGELTDDGGAGNLNAPADGLYWCVVNLVTMKYSITKIESLGCIGGFNGWGSQAALSPSADFLIWTGTVDMNAGDEWKFRANDDWGINLGGSLDNLVYDAGNLKQEEGGKFTVTLNLTAVPYTATVVK